jgi:eukaryotic-like serine/threonine-protein kinase
MELWQKIKSFVWSKHFLKHTGYIVITYIVIVGGTILYLDAFTNHGEKIKLPNLVGMPSSKAQVALEELDLKMELLDSVYRPDLPAGTILEQDPLPTSKSLVYVKSGRIVRVRVSKRNRMVEMPSLIDKSQRFAESVLKNRGLKFRVQYVPTSEANGAVLKQLYKGAIIKEGTRIPIGSVITIVVGENESGEPTEVMDLVNLTISEARGRLQGTSLIFQIGSCDGCTNGEDSTSAIIYSQSPEYLEGVMLPAGTTIMVNASKSGN